MTECSKCHNTTRLTIVKFGGSLFSSDQAITALPDWIAENISGSVIVVTGGGPWVDHIRAIDQRLPLDASLVHWGCIDAMNVTASILAATSAKFELIECPSSWTNDGRDHGESAIAVIRPYAWLFKRPSQLPEDFRVTSDSIAAYLAHQTKASELILLKSCAAPSDSVFDWMSKGMVDDYFQTAAEHVSKIRWVNFLTGDIWDAKQNVI